MYRPIILHSDPIWLNVTRQMIIRSHWITLLHSVEGSDNSSFSENSDFTDVLARCFYYRPQTKLRKGNVFTSVSRILSTGEGVHPLPGRHSPARQKPPYQAETLLLGIPLGRHPLPGRHPLGRYPSP